MNIRRKLMAVVSFAYLIVFGGFLFYSNKLILRGYLDFEREDIIDQTEIGLNTLMLRVSELDQITSEYASRDDTYYFIQNNMRHFINDIIATSSFIENEINFMIITDAEGEIRYSKAFDLNKFMNQEINETIIDTLRGYSGILSGEGASGLIMVNGRPTMIAAHKITYSDEDLPPIGSLICGRYIDAVEVARLSNYSYQDLTIMRIDKAPIPLEEGVNIWRRGRGSIAGLAALKDIEGTPILVLLSEASRDIYHQGESTVFYFYAVMMSIMVFSGILFIYLINKTVLERVLGLSDEVNNIDPRSLESKAICMPGDDEISRLSSDIDEMLQTINEYQDLLTKRERMATIGETAAMVGHDLRNPLQVIYMLSSRIRRLAGKLRVIDEMDVYVKEIESIEENLGIQTQYMNKIVSDLQDFSKSIDLQRGEVNLEYMVMDVLETLELGKDITVSVTFEDDSKTLHLDGNYFRRVIVNLLTNAVQAMPEGGELTVSGSKEGESSIITITDTGVGISEENMGKLFTPLFTTKAKGTGLGLAVCNRIVDAHNGNIFVESDECVGTTFKIILPRKNEKSGKALSTTQELKVLEVSD